MSSLDRVTDMKAKMKQMRIGHTRLADAQKRLHILRETGNKSRGAPQKIAVMFGPTGSGKSTVIRDLLEQVQKRERPEPGRHPILHVTLSSNATVKQLGFDIVDALDEHGLPEEVLNDLANRNLRSKRRTEAKPGDAEPRIMAVATRMLKLARVELLVIDEVHHLVHSDGAKKTAWSVSEALKKLAITGVCPMVLVGTGEARRIVSRKVNKQIVQRLGVPILFPPLDIDVPDDLNLFVSYVQALDLELVKMGIFTEPSSLSDPFNLARLYDVSAGVIGTVSDLVEVASEVAIHRDAQRIDMKDLSQAAETWAVPLGHVDTNPWVSKPRDVKSIKQTQKELWTSGSL